MEQLQSFYQTLTQLTNSKPTNSIYITKITGVNITKRELSFYEENNLFFKDFFNHIYELVHRKHDQRFEYICDSFDIDEGPEHGDYIYYTGLISPSVGFIYHEASHEFFPSRFIFYGTQLIYTVVSDSPLIEVDPMNPKVRQLFYIEPRSCRIDNFKEWLRNTDRPRFDK